MQHPSRLKHHAALVDDMAEVQGLDLEEQMLRGALSFTDLEDAVLRCTGCAAPDRCAHWLAERKGTRAEAPDYCRNHALFDDLRRAAQ